MPAGAPLDGLLLLDLSRHLPGPLAARLLRDLGARVVKVEQPGLGDPVRASGWVLPGSGALAEILLAGMESLAVDLKDETGREAVWRFAGRADVLLESFRPGTLARLGMAPEALLAANPRLVLCSISGWGQDGPGAARAGHDLTYQARAGALASTGAAPAAPTADLLGAWSAASAILAKLVERQRTGRGGVIDAALLDASFHGNLAALAAEAGAPRAVGERLPLSGALPCYDVYQTADGGRVAMAALEPEAWERFCRAVQREELVAAWQSPEEADRRAVRELFAGRSRAQWQELFERLDLPAEAVLSAAEARRDPQVAHRLLAPEGDARPGFPARIDGTRPRAEGGLPAVGQDTRRLLAEVGLEDQR